MPPEKLKCFLGIEQLKTNNLTWHQSPKTAYLRSCPTCLRAAAQCVNSGPKNHILKITCRPFVWATPVRTSSTWTRASTAPIRGQYSSDCPVSLSILQQDSRCALKSAVINAARSPPDPAAVRTKPLAYSAQDTKAPLPATGAHRDLLLLAPSSLPQLAQSIRILVIIRNFSYNCSI